MSEAAASSPMPSPKDLWWIGLAEGVVTIVIGLLLLTYPGASSLVIASLVGLWWLVEGLFRLLSLMVDKTMWGLKLFMGILGVLAGFMVISGLVNHPVWTTLGLATIYVFLLGLQGLIGGLVGIYVAFNGGGWGSGIIGALSVIIGIFLMYNPLPASFALPTVFGALALVFGVAVIFMAFKVKNA